MRFQNLIRVFIALQVVIAIRSNADAQQNWDTLPWKSFADYKLQYLNKSNIATNILYDRMFPVANVDEYTGLPYNANTDTTHPDHLMQAYYEMYNASYNTAGMISPDALDDLIKTNGNSRQHPIGIFLYKFNSLDTNALQDHLIDTLANGQFVDVANPPRSPYFTHTSFLASPLLADGQVVEIGEHEFYIDPRFFLHNENFTVLSVTVDFGDGTAPWVVTNPFNQQGTLSFAALLKMIGKTIVGRIIVVGIDVLGRTIMYGSPFKLFVKNTKTYAPLSFCKGGGQKWVIEAPTARLNPINTQYGNPQLEYKNADGQPVKDTAYFYFAGNGSSCNTGVLHKPVVFIDGFDPTNSRNVQKIYEDYINIGIKRNGVDIAFGDYMLNEGYDFVILDFKHGNDLLERNALTLVSLIERLNQTYGSTMQQGITLIGPSMGSLIAQYALAYMEKNNIPHNVKTYISFDGCHQGANVPIGLQNFVEYFTRRGIFKKNKAIREGLYNGLAARQMLAHHVSANSQFPAPDALRTTFLQNLATVNEYPQLCRKVALINGTNTGQLNPFHPNPSETLLGISVKRKGWKSLWGLCGDKICMKLDWNCYTTPNSGTAKVMDNWTVEPLFNLLFWVPLGKTNRYADAAWGNSSQDNAPGGTFGTFFGSEPGNMNESNFVFLLKEAMYLLTGSKRTSFSQNINEFTMMPSYSAADLRLANKNLYQRFDNICPPTPFDHIYAPSQNERHVTVSPQGAQWFENEIRGILPTPNIPPAPNVYRYYNTEDCGKVELSASSQNSMCYYWQATGDLLLNGNSTVLNCVSGSVSVTSQNGAGGTVVVRGYNGNCFTLSSYVCFQPCLAWENPNFRWVYSAPSVGEPLQAEVDAFQNATSYQWFINGQLIETTVGPFLSTYNWPCVSDGSGLTVYAITPCGRSIGVNGGNYSPICYGNRIAYNIEVFPNPSSSQVTVSLKESTKTSNVQLSGDQIQIINLSEIIEVNIIDRIGSVRKRFHYSKGNRKINFNIYDLASDLYYLEVSDGKNKAKIPLLVRK